MARRTIPEPKRMAEVVVERRTIAAFSELLTALGMGETRVEVDDLLEPLLVRALAKVDDLKQALTNAVSRANHLQGALNDSAHLSVVPLSDYSHDVQWRALDADEGVVIRGEWVSSRDETQAKQFLANEMVNLGREDLRTQRLVRCNHFHITSIATPDEEPDPF